MQKINKISFQAFWLLMMVFAVSAALLLIREMWRAATGQLSEADLVMVKESEEAGELAELQAELAQAEAKSKSPGNPKGGNKP